MSSQSGRSGFGLFPFRLSDVLVAVGSGFSFGRQSLESSTS